MGNCRLDQLNVIVNNNSLKGYGTIRLHISQKDIVSTDQQKFNIRVGEDTTVKVIGDGNYLAETAEGLANPANEITIQNDDYAVVHTLFFVSANYDVEISGKYTFGVIAGMGYDTTNKVFSIDLSDLKYCEHLYYIGLSRFNASGNISALSGLTSLASLFLDGNPNVYGDVASLVGLTDIENIKLDETGIGGKVEDLAALTKISDFWITGCNIAGNLEDFANARLPKASGSIRFACNNNILVGGSVVGNDIRYIYFGSSMSGKNPTEAETAQGWCIRNS